MVQETLTQEQGVKEPVEKADKKYRLLINELRTETNLPPRAISLDDYILPANQF